MENIGPIVVGVVIGWGTLAIVLIIRSRFLNRADKEQTSARALLKSHFSPTSLSDISISERRFPIRVRADLQKTIEELLNDEIRTLHSSGVSQEHGFHTLTLTTCITPSPHNPVVATPPEFEDIDIGEERPVRVMKTGLWLLEQDGLRFALLTSPAGSFHEITGVTVQIATPNNSAGTRLTQSLLSKLEKSVQLVSSYRGKILSLEQSRHYYSGESKGITVHKLRTVERDQVILPEQTLKLLDRNVIQFVRQREKLAEFQQSTKKGLLFYGPPGTGKTHTIHYLARELKGHTTLLISAEQVGLLGEYMTLARLLQPSIVVLEDVDLIARNRSEMGGPCEEVLLNKLLNEMDGLKEEADILFLLTTNRPEALEYALASRPGRIDQAIEFPLPDETGRRKLTLLYAKTDSLSESVIDEVVRRTEGVSAAFIKELMRRTVQFSIERSGTDEIMEEDVDNALDEMLFHGGSLNLKLLGATGSTAQAEA